MLSKIIKQFKDIYCFIGVHFWNYKWEHVKFKLPGRSTIVQSDRRYRICTNCYKTQHTGLGIFGGKWFNEDEKEMRHRKKIIRSIKLDKLIRKLS